MFKLIKRTKDPSTILHHLRHVRLFIFVDKKNAAVMGRITWEAVKRPIPNCFNVILTSHPRYPLFVCVVCYSDICSSEFPKVDLVCSSLGSVVEQLNSPPLSSEIENIIILGGTQVYKVSHIII